MCNASSSIRNYLLDFEYVGMGHADDRDEESGRRADGMVGSIEHEKRREIVEQLQETHGQLPLASIATAIAGRTGESLADVITELREHHIPALIDGGTVRFDRRTSMVTLTGDQRDVPRPIASRREEEPGGRDH